jgi:DNA helicase-2/ATP-dependent DNA helicase PcrA
MSEFYPDIMLGPPGTGKTTTLLNILDAELTAKTDPHRIGYVSFTTRAAEEARTRAMKRFSLTKEDLPHFRTIHSMCFRQLGLKGSDILSGSKFQEFADWAGIRVTGRAWSDDGLISGFESGDRILFMENLARIRGVDLQSLFNEDDDEQTWTEVNRVAKALASYKSANGLLDYTDMLSEFVRSGIVVNLDVLLVDEAQDLSHLQWRVIFQLAQRARHVVVAGDDDQAIYRWAGADVEQFIGLAGNVKVLGQSWRCPKEIQDISTDVIREVRHRRPKAWKARKGKGAVRRIGMFDEADVTDKWKDGHATSPVLVLARNSYVLREQVEPLLRAQGMVYELGGKSSLHLGQLGAAESWEALRAGKKVTLGAARSMYGYIVAAGNITRGFKGLGAFGEDTEVMVSMKDLVARGGLLVPSTKLWHDALDKLPREDMSYMLAARRRGEKLRATPRVRLSTIHSAKGAEADHVVLMTEMARRTHREMENNPDDERRVWYVGVTRAREKLTIVNSQTSQECPWL